MKHILFGDKFIKAGIREKVHSVPGPGLGSYNGRFRSRKKFHGPNSPHFLQIILIALVVSSCHHKSLQVKKIFRKKLPFLLLTDLFGIQDPFQHLWFILQKFRKGGFAFS